MIIYHCHLVYALILGQLIHWRKVFACYIWEASEAFFFAFCECRISKFCRMPRGKEVKLLTLSWFWQAKNLAQNIQKIGK
jgi:hypothetical protein